MADSYIVTLANGDRVRVCETHQWASIVEFVPTCEPEHCEGCENIRATSRYQMYRREPVPPSTDRSIIDAQAATIADLQATVRTLREIAKWELRAMCPPPEAKA